MHKNQTKYALFALLWLVALVGGFATASTTVKTFSQPTGETFTALAWEWQEERGWEAENGYTVIPDKIQNRWFYAIKNPQGYLVPTNLQPGIDTPPAELPKHARPDFEPHGENLFAQQQNLAASRIAPRGEEPTAPACLGEEGSVRGVVRNAAGEAIAGVTVQLYWWHGWGYTSSESWREYQPWRATTAEDGSYEIPAEPGYYELRVHVPSNTEYAAYTHAAELEVTSEQTLYVNPILAQGAQIRGSVTNAAGELLAGTACVFSSWSERCQELSNGSYHHTNLAAGEYRVHFHSSGYISQHYDGVSDWSAATAITLEAGEIRGDINAVLIKGGSISGTITAPEGYSHTQGRVYLYQQNENISEWDDSRWYSIGDGETTDTYRFDDLADGEYYVGVRYASAWNDEDNQYPIADIFYNGKETLGDADLISIIGAEDFTGIDLRLPVPEAETATTSLSGTVTDEKSNPLVDVYVVFQKCFTDESDHICGWHDSAYTDAEGRYSFNGLPTGEHAVSFSMERYRHVWQDIELMEEEPKVLDVVLKRFPSSIAGQVVAEESSIPLVGIRVDADDPYFSRWYISSTNVCGYYTMYVENATYRVTAAASRDGRWIQQTYDRKNDYNEGTEIELQDADRTGIDFFLRHRVRVTLDTDSPTISWEAVPGAVAYVIYSNGVPLDIVDDEVTQFTDSTDNPNLQYSVFWVDAIGIPRLLGEGRGLLTAAATALPEIIVKPEAGGTVSCNNNICTATPGSGYQFDGFTGGCTGKQPCDLTTATRNVTANFSRVASATPLPPAQPIPTLSQWGLILLSLVLMGFVMRTVGRREDFMQ